MAAAVVAADQLTKLAVVGAVSEGSTVRVIDDWLVISHVRNTGAAFGVLRGFGGVLALIALIGVIVIAAFLLRRPPAIAGTAAALILGGALGNLGDRLFRGSVVDFVDFRYWPAFNVADAAITIGAILLVLFGVELPRRGGRNTGDAHVPADRGS